MLVLKKNFKALASMATKRWLQTNLVKKNKQEKNTIDMIVIIELKRQVADLNLFYHRQKKFVSLKSKEIRKKKGNEFEEVT